MIIQTLDATVVVPTLGRIDEALALAKYLERLNPAPQKIVFVFQDQEEFEVWTQKNESHLSIGIYCHKKGAGQARNAGAEASTTKFIAFLDDDCEPIRDDWLAEIITPLLYPDVVLSTGPVFGWGAASFLFSGGKQAFRVATPLLIPWGNPESSWSAPCDSVAGGNFAVRRKVFMEFSGFSNQFGSPSLYEETELSLRFARRTGSQVWFTSRAPIQHKQNEKGGMRIVTPRPSDNFVISQRALLIKLVHGSGGIAFLYTFLFSLVRRTISLARTITRSRRDNDG